jgi:hypothetical protein
MRILAISLIFIFSGSCFAFAQCEGDTCIDVSADQENNQVVITVRKGKPGGSVTTSPKPVPSPTSRKPWIPWLPKPVSTERPKPLAVTKPNPRASSRVRTISGSQLSNQVKKLLPTGTIITQPLGDALVQEPVNFMTTTPQQFTTVIIVLDVPITIHLTPVFTWEFGDGNSQMTKLPGAPYPLALIQNTYRDSGEKIVTLTTTWSGFWRAGALSGPINGAITQQLKKQIQVRPAAVYYKA